MLATCSEYFEQIFEKLQCKHPFIVLKDMKCDVLEALLTYMHKGKVNITQEKLPRLIEAAQCLNIKGLAAPDEEVRRNKSCEQQRRNQTGLEENQRAKHKENNIEAAYGNLGNVANSDVCQASEGSDAVQPLNEKSLSNGNECIGDRDDAQDSSVKVSFLVQVSFCSNFSSTCYTVTCLVFFFCSLLETCCSIQKLSTYLEEVLRMFGAPSKKKLFLQFHLMFFLLTGSYRE